MIAFLLSGLAIVATILSFVFRFVPQGSEVSDIPQLFGTPMLVASSLFTIAVWGTVTFGLRYWNVTQSERVKFSAKLFVGLLAWYLIVLVLGRIGFFAFNPLFLPNIIFGFIVIYLLGKYLLSIPKLQQVAAALPPHYIMNVQIFRVMGVVFLILYLARFLPAVFAIPTGLGDIAIGITGPLVAAFGSKKQAVLWHRFGAGDLILAVSLGIVTYSRPLQLLPTNIPSDPIALFPLAIIPLFAVPLSILLHLFGLDVLKKASG